MRHHILRRFFLFLSACFQCRCFPAKVVAARHRRNLTGGNLRSSKVCSAQWSSTSSVSFGICFQDASHPRTRAVPMIENFARPRAHARTCAHERWTRIFLHTSFVLRTFVRPHRGKPLWWWCTTGTHRPISSTLSHMRPSSVCHLPVRPSHLPKRSSRT